MRNTCLCFLLQAVTGFTAGSLKRNTCLRVLLQAADGFYCRKPQAEYVFTCFTAGRGRVLLQEASSGIRVYGILLQVMERFNHKKLLAIKPFHDLQ